MLNLTFNDLYNLNFVPVPFGELIKTSQKFAALEHVYGLKTTWSNPQSFNEIGQTGLFWLKNDPTILIVIGDKTLTVGKTDLNNELNGVVFGKVIVFNLVSSLTSKSALLKCIETSYYQFNN
jgi:hypothetical protein